MKKFYLLLSLFCFALFGQAQTVKTTTAGTLEATLMSQSIKLYEITTLAIEGPIDVRDFKAMRDQMTNLKTLDLSKAVIDEYIDVDGKLGTSGDVETYPKNTIPTYAFCCLSPQIYKPLLNSVILPETTETIGKCAFQNTGLTSFTANCVAILDNAFMNCGYLASVNFTSKVTSLGNGLFVDCNKLSDVYVHSSVPATIANTTFFGTQSLTLHLPFNATATYEQDANWKTFFSQYKEYYLTPSVASVTMTAVAGSKTVTITNAEAGTAWTATSNQAWLTVNPSTASLTTTLAISATQNTSSNDRTGIVTISADEVETKQIIVTQRANGLVAYYPLNSNLLDYSGNAYDATYSGNPAYTSDRENNVSTALEKPMVYAPNKPAFTFGKNNFSIFLWFKTGQTQSLERLLTHCESTISTRYSIINNKGTLQFEYGQGLTINTSNTQLADGNWHSFAVTREGQGFLVYVDGVKNGAGNSNTLIDFKESANLQIGYSSIYSNQDFSGALDDIRLFNRALSAEEIAFLYHENCYKETAPTTPTFTSMAIGSGPINLSAGPANCISTWNILAGKDGVITNNTTFTGPDCSYKLERVDKNCKGTATGSMDVAFTSNIPKVQIAGNVPICNGSTATLTASGADTYKWNTSAQNSSATITTFSLTSNSDYTVTGTNKYGCTASVTTTVSVYPKPESTITATAWDSLKINTTAYLSTGTYTQTVKNMKGCDSIITIQLTVHKLSSIITSFSAQSQNSEASITSNGKAWTATSSQSWLTITTASGNDGTMKFTVAENVAPSQRTAIITVSITGFTPSKQITITQAGAVIDKSTLATAILNANTLVGSAVPGEGNGQYPQTAITAYNTAIATATTVNNSTAATQADVNSATTNLATATTTFNAAKITVNKSLLLNAISNADLKANAAVPGSADGQYPLTAITAFKSAIATAKSVNTAAGSSQAAVDQAIKDLATATITFDATKVVVSKTALTTAITSANALKSAATSGAGNGQYAQADITTYQAAIDAAKAVNVNVGSTQAQVDAAVTTLATATTTFKSKVIVVNYLALTHKIDAVKLVLAAAIEGSGNGQYPAPAKANLQAAINAAQLVASNTAATQAQVDNAVSTLTTAETTFNSKKVVVDYSLLVAAIKTASDAQKAASIGNGNGQYPSTANATLLTAISAANAVAGKTDATQAAVNQAKTDIDAALVAFNAAKITVDFTNLTKTIDTATTLKTSVTIGTANGQYLQSVVTAFEAKIAIATAVKTKTNVTAAEVATATSNLSAAIASFKTSANSIAPTNFTALNNAITDAKAAIAGKTIGTNPCEYLQTEVTKLNTAILNAETMVATNKATQGEANTEEGVLIQATSDFLNAKIAAANNSTLISAIGDANETYNVSIQGDLPGQYPKAAVVAFKTAIGDAEVIANDKCATSAQIAATTKAVTDARALFLNSVIPAPDKTNLNEAITSATDKINASVVGSGNGQYPSSAKTTLQTAIDAAQAVSSNTVSTQAQVDAATQTLSSAITAFESQKIVVDYSALTAKITTVSTLFAASTEGLGNGQYPAPAKADLQAAIDAAQLAASNMSISQAEVVAAVNVLTNAETTFKNKKVVVDYSLLVAAINTASDAQTAASIGNGDGQYPTPANATLLTAISVANAVAGKIDATQAAVNQAKTDIDAALVAFNAAKISVDLTDLTKTIDTATTLSTSVTIGTANGEYLQAVVTAFEAKIATAKVVKTKANVTAAEVATATSNLSAAIATFKTSANSVAPTDFTKVNKAIADAKSVLKNAKIGTEPCQNTKADSVTLAQAITSAEAMVLAKTATQAEADNKTVVLNNAINTFENNVIAAADNSALVAAIDEIQEMLKSKTIGDLPGQYPQAAITTFTVAITAAQNIVSNKCATAQQITAATTSLTNAKAVFLGSVIAAPVKTTLNEKIAAATPLAATPASSIGTSIGQYSQASFAALQTALQTAQTVSSNVSATQTEVTTASAGLTDAIAKFNNSKIYCTVSPKVLQFGAKAGSSSLKISTNATGSVTTNNSAWLTLASTNFAGDALVSVSASANRGTVSRTDTVTVLVGSSKIKIAALQVADTIVATPSTKKYTISLDSATKQYALSTYFKYYGISTISYIATSSDEAVVKPAVVGSTFGFVPKSKGSATVTIVAKSATGAINAVSFTVEVSSTQAPTVCTLTASITANSIACAGQSTGFALVTAHGGTSPYRYRWSNTRSDSLLVDVPAGAYSVVVTDAKNCLVVAKTNITEPEKLNVTPTINAPSCGQSNGSITLAVEKGTSPYTYAWNDKTTGNNIAGKKAGLYSVTVTDAKQCVLAQNIELNDAGAPVVAIDSVVATSCKADVGKIAVRVTGGTEPYAFVWNDSVKTKDRSALKPGLYSLTVTDITGCKATIKTSLTTTPYQQPHISLVTVSQESNKNLVVWMREDTKEIDFYTIYRESVRAGVYTPIAQVKYDSISVYVDTAKAVNPNVRSWRYKLSATDFCKTESPKSAEFKTMHLQKNVGIDNSINLEWDSYEGSDYYTYLVYRKVGTVSSLIDSLPASVNRYTDLNPVKGCNYFVSILLPDSLNPKSKLKSDSGPFSQSLSNMSEASLVSETETMIEGVSIYPNPAKELINISAENADGALVSLIASSGVIVAKTTIVNGKAQFLLGNLIKGIYTVQLQTNQTAAVKTLVVE